MSRFLCVMADHNEPMGRMPLHPTAETAGLAGLAGDAVDGLPRGRRVAWLVMNACERPRTRVRYALWLTGLVALLAGIVGMHGLNSHGAMAAGTHPPAHSVVTELGEAPRGSDHGAMTTGVGELVGAVTSIAAKAVAAVPSGTAGGMDAMGGMCVAILVLALTGLLRLLRGAPGMAMPYRLVTDLVRGMGPHARDPDPPSLIRLSIQRC